MAITLDHEPDVRSAWRQFHRSRRLAQHGRTARDGGLALLVTLLAGLGFWALLAYGLSLVL